ncbi:serine dehydratase subunit alpha family protein [Chakrabartyella piscis]|uniref:L-cysteine desulfidase family protein n=1 Tax=Chakrabartyella piscis TaxID=2918914 RepID=UPI0029588795|nr:L-serine ammonia-lyase, iron-sulfur-dependent, subunit alpha [Chakrabartyella piscis]
MNPYTMKLQQECKPALGVTEVGAVALCTSRAYVLIGGKIQHISVCTNGGVYKNGFSCGIPATNEIGTALAAALGAVGGKWELGLECLRDITDGDIAVAKEIAVESTVDGDKDFIWIAAKITTDLGVAEAHIAQTHGNFVYLAKDGEVLFQKELTEEAEVADLNFDAITIADLVDYAKNVDLEEILFLRDMIEMNVFLSEKGAVGTGLGLGVMDMMFMGEGVLAQAQKLTCSAMDARLAGLPYPAMSIVGSGSHGILCSLPVVAYAKHVKATEEALLRALALSGMITIYSKHYTGRLSALCGCVLGGGSGAAGGIVYLMGGDAKAVSAAMDHMAANLTGMICDGGSIGCALKASTGVYTAILSANIAMQGIAMPNSFGILGQNVEETTKNLGIISAKGMAPMDETIIEIMQGSNQ